MRDDLIRSEREKKDAHRRQNINGYDERGESRGGKGRRNEVRDVAKGGWRCPRLCLRPSLEGGTKVPDLSKAARDSPAKRRYAASSWRIPSGNLIPTNM